MFKSYKNRSQNGKPVKIYRNLHSEDFFSIKGSDGLVVGHTNHAILRDCEFIVSEKGRQRALKSGHRNVHAYIKCSEVFIVKNTKNCKKKQIVYNYKKDNCFKIGRKKIVKAKEVLLVGGKAYDIS